MAIDEREFHCRILGVSANASADEVKKAYRELAKLLHPDKHQNNSVAKEKFQQAKDAYDYLMKFPGTQSQNSYSHHEPPPDNFKSKKEERKKADEEPEKNRSEKSSSKNFDANSWGESPLEKAIFNRHRLIFGGSFAVLFIIFKIVWPSVPSYHESTVTSRPNSSLASGSRTLYLYAEGRDMISCKQISVTPQEYQEFYSSIRQRAKAECGNAVARLVKEDNSLVSMVTAETAQECNCVAKAYIANAPLAMEPAPTSEWNSRDRVNKWSRQAFNYYLPRCISKMAPKSIYENYENNDAIIERACVLFLFYCSSKLEEEDFFKLTSNVEGTKNVFAKTSVYFDEAIKEVTPYTIKETPPSLPTVYFRNGKGSGTAKIRVRDQNNRTLLVFESDRKLAKKPFFVLDKK